MTEKIYEKKSLKAIMRDLNLGLIDCDDPKQIQIVSDKKPGFLIKFMDIDISEYCIDMLLQNPEQQISQCESNIYDFVVFNNTIDPETNKNTMMVSSLFELILMSEIATESKDIVWSLDTEEWDLLITK